MTTLTLTRTQVRCLRRLAQAGKDAWSAVEEAKDAARAAQSRLDSGGDAFAVAHFDRATKALTTFQAVADTAVFALFTLTEDDDLRARTLIASARTGDLHEALYDGRLERAEGGTYRLALEVLEAAR
ncbi:hypothetical protein [Sinomonas sp. R1AF57]|uniref:hypothetical protein n=1 Tax=Sinomonas sp. R1AF57 TaxID=2020377 RepID=UPI000B5DFE41|nr:hypothetical protein [Sinomonas sp. R1AF57]ASN52496.1 hypothetical protein CGQ25_10765 [Sinomonas sp. R1AF57]